MEKWLAESRHYRETKTVRLDTRLLKLIPKDQGISDVLNLALNYYLRSIEGREFGKSLESISPSAET